MKKHLLFILRGKDKRIYLIARAELPREHNSQGLFSVSDKSQYLFMVSFIWRNLYTGMEWKP